MRIQDYIDQKYSNKETTTKIEEISSSLELEAGELVVDNYPQLELIGITCWGVKNITKVTITNCPKLQKVNIIDFVDNQELIITNCPNLKELWCSGNQLTTLDLSAYSNLKELLCSGNQLTNLGFLRDLNPQQLETLDLSNNNFPPQGLTFLTPFSELKRLLIGYNNFTGSLEPLRNMNKLVELDIVVTDISHGLEYLPKSVKELECAALRPNAKVSDIYEELQPFGGEITKWRAVKLDKQVNLLTAPLLPLQLQGKATELTKLTLEQKEQLIKKLESKSKSGDELTDLFDKLSLQQLQEQVKSSPEQSWEIYPNYDYLHFNQWKINTPSLPNESPTKLYNFNTKAVIKATNLKKPYAILSYVWGDRESEAMKKIKLGKKGISNSANKALTKAIKALEVFNKELKDSTIRYIWVDQLCMNQADQVEKSEEVPKMGKYYDNAALTLIDMNSNLGDTSGIDLMDMLRIIVNSEWFSRSWTYQEGWLSKHTLFMFDDKLVDGRAMAGTWALNQLAYVDGGKYTSRSQFEKGTKKIATPVGWVYYREGYDSKKDKVELTLTQALQAIKTRKRTEPLDGIYSILGLLPYGKEVKVSYDKSNTPQDALKQVMKVAINNGYAEPLTWHGNSNQTNGWCCLPQIDANGSTSVQGSVGRVSCTWDDKKLIFFTKRGLEFDSSSLTSHYVIKQTNSNIYKLESGFEITGGLYQKEVMIVARDTKDNPSKLALAGTKETLELVKNDTILVVLYKEFFGTNKLLALLVKKTNQANTYHRLGLVELGNSEVIKFSIKRGDTFIRETIIGSQPELVAQIQVSPQSS